LGRCYTPDTPPVGPPLLVKKKVKIEKFPIIGGAFHASPSPPPRLGQPCLHSNMYQEKNVAKLLLQPVFCIAVIIRIIENVGRNSIPCIFAKD
jgi:hypothetical protein